FSNIVLADEINRASPKTQSALLEAMQERRVTVFGQGFDLPSPFFVMATQNPIELEGTYPLPEAQIDRFLLKLTLETTAEPVLREIIATRHRGEPPELGQVMSAYELSEMFALVDRVHLPSAVAAYISRLVSATHRDHPLAPDAAKQFVKYGASPRAAIAIAETARAEALLAGKPNVGFEEVKRVAAPAMAHRLVLDYTAKIEGVDGPRIVADIVQTIPELERDLPEELKHDAQ
ncbi:AAA family ATPase, partial [bacterium]|nr:AAA family ATPase [bacterium]